MGLGTNWSNQRSSGKNRFTIYNMLWMGFPGESVVKNPPANAGDSGSIPTSERSLKKELATHPGILAREIPWTEEPGGLQFLGLQKSWTQLSD